MATSRRLVGAAAAAGVSSGVSSNLTFADSSTTVPPLRDVVVVFRHGARSPVHRMDGYPAMPALVCTAQANASLPQVKTGPLTGTGPAPALHPRIAKQREAIVEGGGNCFTGQLTDLGIVQVRALGAKLRARYGGPDGCVGPSFEPERMTVRSTNIPRCVASAQGVLDGLFPSTSEPIPLRISNTNETEYLTPNKNHCALVEELFNAGHASWRASPDPEVTEAKVQLRALNLIPEEIMAKMEAKNEFIAFRDVLIALHAHGQDLWGVSTVPGLLKRVDRAGTLEVERLMKGNSAESTAAMNKAGLGFWLGELSDRWTARSHSTSADTTTLSLVSAHDTTLIPILIALGVMESGEWPDYASSIIFELYSRGVDGKQGLDSQVRVIYNDEVITHKIPGAGGSEYVPVRKLQELIDSFRPRDLERDCMTSQEKGRGAASEGGKDTF